MDFPNDRSDRNGSAALESGHRVRCEDGRGPDPAALRPAVGVREGTVVRVTKFPFDWNDVDYATIMEPVAERLLRIVDGNLGGCFYLNPQMTVYSPVPSIAFVKKARRGQAAWCRRFAKAIGAANFHREARNRDFWTRQLGYYGIMVIDGTLIAPNAWKRILVDGR